MTNKIELLNVKKSFNGRAVLDGINLGIQAQRSTIIVGASGTGKSVMLRAILGFLEIDSGRILFDEEETKRDKKFMSEIGVVFQNNALFDSLQIWENVAFELIHGQDRMKRSEAKDIAIAKIERVGLPSHIFNRYPLQMSGGMQRRIALARAIATEPKMLFFDEPTAGLDPISSHVISDLIREVVEELNATALTITHSLKAVRHIADRVALVDSGVIRWTGRVDDFDTTQDAYVRQFIEGNPEGPIRPRN